MWKRLKFIKSQNTWVNLKVWYILYLSRRFHSTLSKLWVTHLSINQITTYRQSNHQNAQQGLQATWSRYTLLKLQILTPPTNRYFFIGTKDYQLEIKRKFTILWRESWVSSSSCSSPIESSPVKLSYWFAAKKIKVGIGDSLTLVRRGKEPYLKKWRSEINGK